MIEAPLAVAGLIVASAALAFWLDFKVRALSKVGASLMAIAFGAALSNAGVVPATSPVYDAVGGPLTSLAIVWLLLSVNLRDLRAAGPRMLGAFGLAVLGTVAGAFVGAFVYAGVLGEDTWRLAGTLTGTYTGGSVNFVAVGRALELPETLFAGATAADALSTALWLAATLMLPIWLAPFFPAAEGGHQHGEGVEPAHPFFVKQPVSTMDLSVLVAVGFVLLIASEWLGALVPWVHPVLWLTTLALVVGHSRYFDDPRGALQVGTLALHFFFVVIGIWSRVADIFAVGVHVFYYTSLVVAVHGLIVYGVGRWLRFDLGTLSVASQAAVGGPSSALAVAVSRKWPALILPGVIVGLVGYAVGNYIGFGVGQLVRALAIGL